LRYFVRLSYLGTPFHGWQIQPNALSVQQELNRVLSTILTEEISVVGAGRTDTGVHAREMWAHFDTSKPLPQNLLHRANSFIGKDIALYEFIKVRGEAHARFDAVERSYEYHFTTVKNPFAQQLAWHYPWPLHLGEMSRAAACLLDYEDFTSFSKSNTQTFTNLCDIKEARFEEKDDRIIFHITANRFLRNMVRAIVGTLIEVGKGKYNVDDFRKIIESKDRRLAGESAPAHGLYLTRVSYPKETFNG
jgi:tRNA pseudouridine38-40 synthase